jgi:PadR family transcriptional regulator
MGRLPRELLPGTLDLLILSTLKAGPQHGYAIVRRIQETSARLLHVEEGSLYPCLHRMEERGWIASEWGATENNRQARFCRLTRAGRRQLVAEAANWSALAAAVTRVVEAS